MLIMLLQGKIHNYSTPYDLTNSYQTNLNNNNDNNNNDNNNSGSDDDDDDDDNND